MSAAPAEVDADRWVVAQVEDSGFRTSISARRHTFVADEPESLGGSDAGPTPYEMLLAALASCMAMTLRMYASRKKWPLDSVEVRLRTKRTHKADCENCETGAVGIKQLERRITLTGTLSEEQKTRLLQVAERCPVKQALESGIAFTTVPGGTA